MEVLPGLHWVDRIWDSKVYVLIERDRLVIIDAAMPGRARAIWQFMASLGYPPEAVDEIWITHADIDHMGSVAALKEHSGAQVVVHRDDVPLLEGTADRLFGPLPLVRARERLFNWAIRHLFRFRPTTVDRVVEDGDSLGDWQVVHVPGHTAGSVCFYNPARELVIVGDAINHRSGQLGAPLPIFSIDMAEATASVGKIAGLRFETCCFGHGPPLTENARERVQKLANRLPN